MRVRRWLAVAAVPFAVLVPAGSTPAAAPGLVDGHPCSDAAGFTCSTLAVPLDHTGRRRGTVRLAVAAADNRDAPRGVLLVLAGGPGQPGVPLIRRVRQIVGAETDAYRLVVFDQRGTGAGALACPALQDEMGFSDLYPPSPSAVKSCAAAVGARRSLFGTDDVVADMESLRRALGVDRWAIDGISYGTYVGERYALAHPDRVSKLVLDSVVPHAGMTDLGVAEMHATARVLRDACRPGGCSGDPAADLASVVARQHDGARLLDAITFVSIVDPTFRSVLDVPEALHQARSGDGAALRQLLATVHRSEAASPDELSQGLHASALCADWRFPWGDSSAPLRRRATALARAVHRLRPASLWPFDRRTASQLGFVTQCLPWAPTPPTPAPAPGEKLRVPALLVNGDHDLSTPLEWARQELRLAPRGQLVVVHGAGHSVQSRAVSDAGRQAVASFLLG